MEEKKKKFIIPEAEIIDFISDDIVTTSGLTPGEEGAWTGQDGDDW